MAKKAYIGVENFTPRELPNGYTQVEYIESSGTQYIDTGFKPKGTTKIICDFQMVNQGTEQQGVFGSRPGASGRFTVFTGDSTGALQVDYDTYGALAKETSTISGLNLNNRNTIEVNNSLIINENTVKTVSAVSFTSTYNLFLFANNNVGTVQLPGSMKLYSFKIYDNETLVRDFVPCIVDSTGEVGLYDLVNGGFYQNAGSGAFTAGNTHGGCARKIKKGYVGVENFTPRTLPSGYTQIEYIQSSGTQWIDTGFKPNQDTRVVMNCYVISFNSCDMFLFGARVSAGNTAFYIAADDTNTKWFISYGNNVQNPVGTCTGHHSIDMNKNSVSIDDAITTLSASTFQSASNLLLFATNTAGSADSQRGTMNLYSFQIYDNGTLVRDYIPCQTTAGEIGLWDDVNSVFYGNAGTGTFTAGSTHASLARKIKKAYIGIGGIARPCWAGGTITKYGTIDATSDKIENSAGASNGDYAIFAGGSIYAHSGNGTQTNSVFAYSKSLTLSKPTSLPEAVVDLAATNIGDFVIFGGGQLVTATSYKNNVSAYNKSLTRTIPTNLSQARCRLSAANAGDKYAIFAGGYYGSYCGIVDAYNASLTRTTSSLNVERDDHAGTSLGDYAIFAGGGGGGIHNSCETFDSSLTRATRASLGTARYALSAAHVGKYAIFAGGFNQKGPVDVYNESFTRSALGNIATDGRRYHIAATQVDGFAIFAGGVFSLTVDLYDESLTHTLAENLTNNRAYSCAASVGDYALIFGGRGTLNGEDVEVYMLA